MRFRLAALVLLLATAGACPAPAAGPEVTLLSAATTAATSATSLTAVNPGSEDAVWVQASGTYTASSTVVLEVTRDGINWTTAVASIATGEMWRGPVCECLLRARVATHEGGGKTVTVKAWIAGKGTASAQ